MNVIIIGETAYLRKYVEDILLKYPQGRQKQSFLKLIHRRFSLLIII